MGQSSFSKKRVIHIYIIVFIIVLLMLISAVFMLKYYVEGETNLPFNLKEIDIISTAESNLLQDEYGIWNAEILQKNDVFFVIEKNSNYKKENVIKTVTFDNFVITKSNNDMVINIYRPTTSINTYIYSDEYIADSLQYVGGQTTNMETLQINNQGGTIGFSITADNIGKYTLSENEKLPSDGRLIAKAGVKEENIKFKVSFDLIIETESNHKFKSNITLDLPTGNILEEGVGKLENTELNDVIFKRF